MPLPVKTISAGACAPMSEATCARARATAAAGAAPNPWELEGLPTCVVRNGSIASTTRGSTGVVPL